MSKYTRGPWHYIGGTQIRSKSDMIAKVWMMRGGEGIANAQLMAAAPELLEALQWVMTAHGEQLESAFEAAQSAIDKATGETS